MRIARLLATWALAGLIAGVGLPIGAEVVTGAVISVEAAQRRMPPRPPARRTSPPPKRPSISQKFNRAVAGQPASAPQRRGPRPAPRTTSVAKSVSDGLRARVSATLAFRQASGARDFRKGDLTRLFNKAAGSTPPTKRDRPSPELRPRGPRPPGT